MRKPMILWPLLASVASAARADERPPEVELVSALGDCAGHAPRLLVTPGEGFKLVLDDARLETSEAQASARYFCTVNMNSKRLGAAAARAPVGFDLLGVEAQLQDSQAVVVIVPPVVLEGRVQQRILLRDAVSVHVDVEIEQRLGDIEALGLAGHP